jgi:hypothetical protein
MVDDHPDEGPQATPEVRTPAMPDCGDILKRLDTMDEKNDKAHKAMYKKLETLSTATAVDGERIEATRERCDERHALTSKFMWGIGSTIVLAAGTLLARSLLV